MASGFILANKRGIAVSMDTMEGTAQGEEHQGFKRLFPLGGQHKVVAVSIGVDNFMNYPIEILVQQFTQQLPAKPLAGIADYTNAFVEFLNQLNGELSTDWFIENNTRFILENLYDNWVQLSQNYRNQYSFEQLFTEAVNLLSNHLQVSKQNVVTTSLDRKAFIDQYAGKIEQVVNTWVKELTSYGPTTNGGYFADQLQQPSQQDQNSRSIFSSMYPQIFEIIRNVMTTDLRGNYASIVFAGMGADEPFGSFQLVNLYGRLDQILYNSQDVQTISNHLPQFISSVSTFNQQSIGAQLLQKGLATSSFNQIQQILANNGMSKEDQQRVITTLQQSTTNHDLGIRETIVNLSPEELAKMSRTMIETNRFISRYMIRNSGVGGKIETIIITYQKGPVWLNE